MLSLAPRISAGRMHVQGSARRYAPGPGGSAQPLSDPYTMNLASNENPVSQGGNFLNGYDDGGGQWLNMQIAGGLLYASAIVEGGGYNDDTCCAKPGTFNSTSQFAQGTYFVQSGYNPPSSHEAELLVLWSIADGFTRGYEWLLTAGGSYELVRWNGPLGGFTAQGNSDDSLATGKGWTDTPEVNNWTGGFGSGEVARLECIVTAGVPRLYCYRGATLVLQVRDTSAYAWSSGQPGFGAFPRTGATINYIGWSAASLGSL